MILLRNDELACKLFDYCVECDGDTFMDRLNRRRAGQNLFMLAYINGERELKVRQPVSLTWVDMQAIFKLSHSGRPTGSPMM